MPISLIRGTGTEEIPIKVSYHAVYEVYESKSRDRNNAQVDVWVHSHESI
jgi:hypothetical protein